MVGLHGEAVGSANAGGSTPDGDTDGRADKASGRADVRR